jgi:hypothetical protein
MGSGTKKKKGEIDMGNYTGTIREREAYVWCINHNIYISPKASSTTEWNLSIVINGKQNVSPDTYKKIDIWKQMYKYYLYYYNKYSGIEDVTVVETKVKQKVIKEVKKSSNETLF